MPVKNRDVIQELRSGTDCPRHDVAGNCLTEKGHKEGMVSTFSYTKMSFIAIPIS